MGSLESEGRERELRALRLFEEVVDLPAGQQRAVLDEACAGDQALRGAVADLLSADRSEILERAVAGEAAKLLESEEEGGRDSQAASSALTEEELGPALTRLRESRPAQPRYALRGELARGGMGRILKAWDPHLRRDLAMKVLHDQRASSDEEGASRLLRFLEEAQVTGQLDHPGIVSVHELGMDADNRLFFTMPLVRGQDLSDIFAEIREGRGGWTQTRVLGLILRACEAMSYAHSKGVIHRDLKPSNIRVGRFGEVYVMDWGVARVLGKSERHDLRIAPAATASLHTERHHSEDPDSGSLRTMDGRVVGTPYYMSLEQAEGRVESIGPHSDVYAVGAMLYELLAGQRPYERPGARVSPHTVLAAVLDREPRPLRASTPEVPPELAAICEKAMARRVEDRYPDTLELARDLRAYLEQRVVGAYEVGAVAELRKWVQRNRLSAAVLVAAVGLSVGLLAWMWAGEARHARDLSEINRSLSVAQGDAQRHLDNHQRLADINELSRLRQRAGELWPAWPRRVPEYQAWLADADSLFAQLPLHRDFLRALGPPVPPSELPPSEAPPSEASAPEASGPGLAAGASPSRERWLPDLVRGFVADLEAFGAESRQENNREDVRWRLANASSLQRRSVLEHEDAWDEALSELMFDPRFEDCEFEAQMGLVPLGPDPDSGLWEFAVLGTGSIPVRDSSSDELLREDDFAIVLALLPPAVFFLGAQGKDAEAEQYELQPGAAAPMHEVSLEAFFFGKYELTQSQWFHMVQGRPSFFPLKGQPPPPLGAPPWKRLPVEQVSYGAADHALLRFGLDLPTEAQWEYAARAGTRSRWWCGTEAISISQRAAGNLFDRDGDAVRGDRLWGDPLPWRDGCAEAAAVGSYTANEFGIHDTIGNVMEWCRDWYGSYRLPVGPGDGRRQVPEDARSMRCQRGGAFSDNAEMGVVNYRHINTPDTANFNLGVRAARRLVLVQPGRDN